MMPNEMIITLYFVMWYLLATLAVLFVVSGLDDLFIDGYYWVRFLWRMRKTRHYEPLSYEKLTAKKEQFIAVLIPCWNEANIIGTMLRHNAYSVDYKNYYFFVGVYPNDPETVAEVQGVADVLPQVQCVVGDAPGPTNKASNLNAIYQRVKAFEMAQSISFDIYVFHDSEDIIHPLSFKLYNHLIPRKDMVQTPVFPLEVSLWNFTHWLYADEFSENHTKDIIVRESMHAHVPSAGVGTAFSKHALTMLENKDTATPFATHSLTEDYHTSLALRELHLKSVFVTQAVIRMRWRRRKWGSGYVKKQMKEYIATRALFPLAYKKAVRQKARWIIGIVFQEWDLGHWPSEWQIRYSLAHDRKSFITHFINGFGYVVFTFWLVYSGLTYGRPEYPALQEQFNLHPWVWWLVLLVTCIMFERLLQRVIAVSRIYGIMPALLSIPRAFYGNMLNLHALIRAYGVYFTAQKSKTPSKQPAWDKTEHQFPGRHVLVPYRRKLGDLLLENDLINPEQLERALCEQGKTGERLGEVLCRLALINKTALLRLLATQYQVGLFPQSKLEAAQQACRDVLPKKRAAKFAKHGIRPVAIHAATQRMTVAIDDPTNELLLKKVMRLIAPFKADFVLMSEE
ncbi:MAG TPA: phage adsorption protein NrfB [Legionella sp.]|nr:phage adsorption protein NrfB [Legionella sp.]